MQTVRIALLRLNLTQLQAIDHMCQTFTARFFWHMAVEGGAEEADLAADLDPESQTIPDGARPGIGWYINQLDFPTAREVDFCRKKCVLLDDSDLHITIDICGTFYESMELQQFPLDVQQLTMVASLNCAKEGVLPVMFDKVSLKQAATAVNLKTFALANMWKLFPGLVVRPTKVDPMPARTYPALSVSVLVERKPFTLFTNVVVPVSSLTVLSGLCFVLPTVDYGERLNLSLTMMLTSAAYKLVVADRLPEVAYLTLLDKYVLCCYTMMALVVVEAVTISRWVDRASEQSPSSLIAIEISALDICRLIDRVAAMIFATVYLILHLYVVYRWCCRPRLMQEVIDSELQPSDAMKLQHSFSHENSLRIYKQYAERAQKPLEQARSQPDLVQTPATQKGATRRPASIRRRWASNAVDSGKRLIWGSSGFIRSTSERMHAMHHWHHTSPQKADDPAPRSSQSKSAPPLIQATVSEKLAKRCFKPGSLSRVSNSQVAV